MDKVNSVTTGRGQLSPEELQAIKHSIECWKRLHWCRSKVNSAFEIASLMAVFSLIATVEIPLPQGDKEANPNLVIAFVSISSSLVAVTVIVKVISTSILPLLDNVAEMHVNDSVRSPHDQILPWIFLTCILGHTVAPVLFCIDVVLVSWIKFPKFAEIAPFAVTFIILPMIVVILRFGVEFAKEMRQFKITLVLNFPHEQRRYSEIAEIWEEDQDSCECSEISTELSERDHLLKSHCSITSYGAVVQNEFVGSPNSIFADVI